MDRFQACLAFARVVEQGSFARAADRLGLSVSAVSRQVAELEAHLDARLLHRTTRRLSLTEAGRAFYERCVQLLADLEEAEESARAGAVRPRGTLRMSCSITFGARHLAPAVAAFMERHPDVHCEVELSDRAVDLVDEGYDLAVRIGAIGSQNVVGRRLGATELLCCAAPGYLARHGEPATPDDLAGHACLTYAYASAGAAWTFRGADGAKRTVHVSGPVHANSGRFLEAMAVAGSGLTQAPDIIVGPDMRAGRLVRVLRGFEPPPLDIHVVYPSRRHLSAKVRAFTDFLVPALADAPWSLTPPRPKPAARSRPRAR